MQFDLLRRLARCTSGSATLEAALVMPVIISLLIGGVSFGQLFSAYGTAEKSMRDAARYLARVPAPYVCTWGLSNALNLAVYGNTTGTAPTLLPGWTTATVHAYWMPANVDVATCGTPDDGLQLRATVGYRLVFGVTWTMNVKHEERWVGE
jgi:Flp pilus assembly protein TadG